jgi:hypothetical protein
MVTADGLAAARRAFVQKHRRCVQIISERDREEQQHKRATHRRPFAERVSMASRLLTPPTRAPDTNGASGNQNPKQIKEQFHFVT